MTQTTCALAVIHNGHILIALPTNGSYKHGWSLPKGIMDPGERYGEAALRECWEETGNDFRHREAELIDLGVHAYRPHKNYHLSVLHVSEPIDTKACVCESMFIHNEKEYPEVSHFAFVTIEVAVKDYLNKNQAALVETLILNQKATT